MPLRMDVVTIFPDFFNGLLQHGVVVRALRSGLASVHPVNLRDFATDRHRTVDDRPFGGGEGMVLKPEPLAAALASLQITPKANRDTTRESVVLLSAQGRPFTQQVARHLAGLERLVLLCGRYEGVDERVNTLFCDEELSIGDYVLSGGELAAAVVIDAVVRLLPGVLGNADSAHNESFGPAQEAQHGDDGTPLSTAAAGGLLDYPHYTRPAEFLGLSVPDALVSGDHVAIRAWRRREALRKTWQNRPELLAGASLSDDDLHFLEQLRHSSE